MSGVSDSLPAGLRPSRARALLQRVSGDGAGARTGRSALIGVAARVFNAGVLLLTHILLARLIGADAFGLFSLAVTWTLTLLGLATLGLTMTPQRFAPGYLARGEMTLLAGLYRFSHVAPFLAGCLLALLAATAFWLFPGLVAPETRLAVMVAMLALPALAVIDVVEGFALANDWHDLAYGVTFGLKPLLLPALALALWLAGSSGALMAVAAFAGAAWIAALALVLAMAPRMADLGVGGRRRTARRDWFSLALPALMADGAMLAMASADVLVLAAFASHAEVGVYVAATKIAGLVAFVHFGLSYAAAHHFAALHEAGDRAAFLAYARQAARWTFWPALAAGLAALALAPLLLGLFGPAFAAGAAVLPLLIGALLVRAAIGPSEQLLMMSDRQRDVTLIQGAAALANIALAFALAPRFGAMGVAVAVAAATLLGAGWTAIAVRRAHGGWVHAFARGAESPPGQPREAP